MISRDMILSKAKDKKRAHNRANGVVMLVTYLMERHENYTPSYWINKSPGLRVISCEVITEDLE